MQTNKHVELWISFFAILAITLFYLAVVIFTGSIPGASEFFGHSLGIIGFILMIITETLYSIRKRNNRFTLGRMVNWLRFHIITGLVGPYMVLLHSSWKFNGLAGITMLLTIIIVLSGFVGRYIYTNIPRNVEGMELDTNQVQSRIASIKQTLKQELHHQPEIIQLLEKINSDTKNNRNLRNKLNRALAQTTHPQKKQLIHLIDQQIEYDSRLKTLNRARRMMALWHTIHLPIGLALFTMAIIHISAAIYYGTMLKVY